MTPSPGSLPDTPPSVPPTGAEVAGAVVSAFWVAAAAVWLVVIAPPVLETGRALGMMIGLIAALLPVMLLWGVLAVLRLGRMTRAQAEWLCAAIEAESAARDRRDAARDDTADQAQLETLAEIRAAQHRIEAALAAPPPPPAPEPAPAPEADAASQDAATDQEDDQEDLPFDPEEAETGQPLAWADFIRALNFPDNPDDTAGFDALRRALRDRPTAQLVRASQDVLTLMAQDGLYMDDLPPDAASPDMWRRFAVGERGRAIAAVGGIRDEAALATVAARMRRDPIFRDAAHHFLRLFDRILAQFAEVASDADISALAETRTARAFMILGRSAGTFD